MLFISILLNLLMNLSILLNYYLNKLLVTLVLLLTKLFVVCRHNTKTEKKYAFCNQSMQSNNNIRKLGAKV